MYFMFEKYTHLSHAVLSQFLEILFRVQNLTPKLERKGYGAPPKDKFFRYSVTVMINILVPISQLKC